MIDPACSPEKPGPSCYATEYQEPTCLAGIIWRELIDECCFVLCYTVYALDVCLKASISMQRIPAFQDAFGERLRTACSCAPQRCRCCHARYRWPPRQAGGTALLADNRFRTTYRCTPHNDKGGVGETCAYAVLSMFKLNETSSEYVCDRVQWMVIAH